MISEFLRYEKLMIESYQDISRNASYSDTEYYVAMFNPSSYSMSYVNIYDSKQGINTSGNTARYARTDPEVLKIKLIIDGNGLTNTGILDFGGIKKKNVHNEVQNFLHITNYMDGEVHEPKYLILKWGKLIFDCRLASAHVSYTQFDESGSPLRAELDCEFIGDLELAKRLKKERKNSPDLTHYKVVNSHDELPLMCEEIYGSPGYYTLVAQANNLDDFRNMVPGATLFFPPIEN
ncbi:MAG: hypothetical protein WBA74_19090 [Cyclobacteriaceae bacterium]